MPGRRAVLAGLLASGLCPVSAWADVGQPAFLSAARLPDGGFVLVGLSASGKAVFQLPLPGRGHAAAAHPKRAEAVGFARRPGEFAYVLDCRGGDILAKLQAPAGRHFYGHGTYALEGAFLFTTENDIDTAQGRIGVWDADAGYRRVGDLASGGIGPHDIRNLPGGGLVVANGGIETHPDSGRAKLNLADMRPNLSYFSPEGTRTEQLELPAESRRNSLRHLAVRSDGLVAVAAQWQGDVTASPALLATHRRGQSLQMHSGPDGLEREMQGYAGSIAFSGDGSEIAITSPRGGLAAIFAATGAYRRRLHQPDICGVSAVAGGFAFTAGSGAALSEFGGTPETLARHNLHWDNHLVACAG